MTFPARSTALTANPGDLWWNIVQGGNTWICQSTGFEFNRELQQVLHGMNIPVQPSYDGVRVGSSSLTRFGSDWGDTTNRLLWLALKLNAPQALLDVIKSGGRAHLITQSMIAAAAFVITKAHFQHATDVTLGNIRVPADVIPPRWNVAPPAVSNPMLTVCAMSTPDAPPPVQGSWADALFDAGNAPPPPEMPQAAPLPVAPPITAGPITTPIPAGVQGEAAPTQEGLSPGGILAGAVVLGGLVALGVSLRKGHSQTGRKNPAGKQIVLAWVTTRLHGLPGVTNPRAVAAMWVNQGGSREIAAAKAYAQKELTKGGDSYPRVFVYEGEHEPLRRARRELAASRGL